MAAGLKVSPVPIPVKESLRTFFPGHSTNVRPQTSTTNQAKVSTSALKTFCTNLNITKLPTVSLNFAKGHPLENLITKDESISVEDIKEALGEVTFHLSYYPSGTIPASTNNNSGYARFAWTRDMAMKAFAMYAMERTNDANKVVQNLARFYNRKEERGRFTNYHWDPYPHQKYKTAPHWDLPQIRAEINDDGHMVEYSQGWMHNQLDAMGMWLYLTFKMANEEKLDLKKLNHSLSLSEEGNDENNCDSIFSVALTFLNRIRYWEQYDVGPWEDYRGYKRASSLGICLAAFKEAHKYLEKHKWNSIKIWNESELKREIENGIMNGSYALKERIPEDGREAIETDTHSFQLYDSALTLLLYPCNPSLSEMQEKAILKTLYNHRMGEIGFTRRDSDNYVGMNYIYNHRGEGIYSNMDVSGYEAAQWSIFDPLLASYHYKKYVNSSGKNEESFLLADMHMKRTLAHITKAKDRFSKASGIFRDISVPKGILPEAYWLDTRENRWRPNENSPLLWTEANFILAIKEAVPAISLWERM